MPANEEPDAPAGELEQRITWRCAVCGFEFTGEHPPKGCPVCHSHAGEFLPEHERQQLVYDGKPFDVLVLNGSTHRAGNTGYMADLAEGVLRERGVSYRRYNLIEHRIEYCWCCYSVRAESCTYPCRNTHDDMPAFHQMLAGSKAVIIAAPINWNGMPARLKAFLDRTTCMENLFHLGKPGLTEGKIVGILVNGHEDGAIKTAMDIWLNFEQLGFIKAPFGIAYRTHGAQFNSKTDREFFRNDELVSRNVRGVVNNVIEMMKLGVEEKLKGRLVAVSE